MIKPLKWRWIGVLALAAVLALLAVLAPALRKESAKMELETLRIATPAVPSVALHWIADDQGFWQLEGLVVETTPTVTGKAALEQVLAKEADLAYTADTPFVISAMLDQPVRLLTTTGTVRNIVTIIGRKDRKISSPQDLSGKRVGIAANTASDYFLWAFLIRNGINPAHVGLVSMSPDKMSEQLLSGAVDAVSIWDPFTQQVLVQLGPRGTQLKAPDAYVLSQLLLAHRDALPAKAPAMTKYLRALLRAERYLAERPERSIELIAGRTGMSVEQLRQDWSYYDFGVRLHQSQLITMESNERWARQKGIYPGTRSTNLLPYIYLDVMKDVAPQNITLIH